MSATLKTYKTLIIHNWGLLNIYMERVAGTTTILTT